VVGAAASSGSAPMRRIAASTWFSKNAGSNVKLCERCTDAARIEGELIQHGQLGQPHDSLPRSRAASGHADLEAGNVPSACDRAP